MSNRKPLETLVEDSYNELTSLLKWFSLFGPIPTIIGGWAVYFYNSYFGSIDIDIIGPSHQGRFIDLIERYERTHGYEFTAKEKGIETKLVELRNHEEVQNLSPSAYGVFNVVYNGKLLSYHHLAKSTLWAQTKIV